MKHMHLQIDEKVKLVVKSVNCEFWLAYTLKYQMVTA